MRTTVLILLMCLAFVGCSSGEPPAAQASEASTGAESAEPAATPPSEAPAEIVAVQPDLAKLKAHIEKHITYPATREQILAACANTNEFTEGEKKWVADRLPEGTSATHADLLAALKIE